MKSPEGFERDKTEDYILAFFIGENNSKEYSKRYRELISCCEKKYKMKVICLNDLSAPENYAITPDELLFYISEAKIVLTNSFHISVFSILFQRQFFVVDRNDGAGKNMGSRLWDLLNEFGLENRIINANSKKEIYEFMSKKIKEISDEDFVSIEIKCKKNKDELLERISRIL